MSDLELGEVVRGSKVKAETLDKDPLDDIEEGEVPKNRKYFVSYRSCINDNICFLVFPFFFTLHVAMHNNKISY